jgi:hypothetical protein
MTAPGRSGIWHAGEHPRCPATLTDQGTGRKTRGASRLSDGVESKGQAPCEQQLSYLRQRMEGGAVHVTKQVLQAKAAEKSRPAHHL